MTTRSTDSATSSTPARKPRAKAAAPTAGGPAAAAQAKPRRRTSTRSNAANEDRMGGTLQQHIAEAAYYRAERRGFQGGSELDDWLEAEAEVTGDMAA